MKTRLFIIGIFLFSNAVSASEQDVYFHIHQAYEYLETGAKKLCPNATQRARAQLVEADRAVGEELKNGSKKKSVFETELKLAWKLVESTHPAELFEIEKVRQAVQSKADSLKLKHEASWHIETRACL